jgi:hypothetical protein
MVVVDELMAPGGLWTPADEMACGAALAGATCDDYANDTIPQCVKVPGSLPNGSACQYAQQCASQTCAVANGSLCGVCTPPATGSSCQNSSSCAPDVYCDGASQCEPWGGLEDPCTDQTTCQSPFACKGGYCSVGGYNVACDPTLQDCAFYLFCSGDADTCQPKRWAQPNEECGWVADSTSVWTECVATDGYCIRPAISWTGVCPAVAQDGEACDVTHFCVFPAVCTSAGVCGWTSAATCQ